MPVIRSFKGKFAEQILQGKAADFDPSGFVDRYEEAVVEMLKKKQAGLAVPRDRTAPPPQNVVNLMDTLRRSIAEEKAASVRQPKARKRPDGHPDRADRGDAAEHHVPVVSIQTEDHAGPIS